MFSKQEEKASGVSLTPAGMPFGKGKLEASEFQKLEPGLAHCQQHKLFLSKRYSELEQAAASSTIDLELYCQKKKEMEDELNTVNTTINKIEGLLDRLMPSRNAVQYIRKNTQARLGNSGSERNHAYFDTYKDVQIFNEEDSPNTSSQTFSQPVSRNDSLSAQQKEPHYSNCERLMMEWDERRKNEEYIPDNPYMPRDWDEGEMEMSMKWEPQPDSEEESDIEMEMDPQEAEAAVVFVDKHRRKRSSSESIYWKNFSAEFDQTGQIAIHYRKRTLADFARGYISSAALEGPRLFKRARLRK